MGPLIYEPLRLNVGRRRLFIKHLSQKGGGKAEGSRAALIF
jgi:hypothetical protein